MLERLLVSGLGIIDAVEVEMAPGFVALTGETGAGKSLLVTSLELVAGRRASTELVRTGDDSLRVEGWFRIDGSSPAAAILDEVGAPGLDPMVIRREMPAASSRSLIAGSWGRGMAQRFFSQSLTVSLYR